MIGALTPEQARELISRGDVQVIDVREPGEWSGGHLPGARHVPLDRLRANPRAAIDHDGVLFVCAAGVRSQAAARIAEQLGFTRIYNLTTGTRGWARAGLPLVRDLTAA